MKREFTAVYHKQGKYIAAWIEEIPGVNTQGKTEREARENLKEALQLIIETNRNLSGGRGRAMRREPFQISVSP